MPTADEREESSRERLEEWYRNDRREQLFVAVTLFVFPVVASAPVTISKPPSM